MSVALLKTEGESLGAWDVLGEREDESGVPLVLGGDIEDPGTEGGAQGRKAK